VSDALLSRVRDLLARGALDEANVLASDALAAAPRDPVAWYMRGIVENRRGDYRAAVKALRMAIDLDPSAGLSWLSLGNALARLDDLPGATRAYQAVVSREPGWADARYNLGVVQRRQGDLDGAARAFHAAWSLDPMMFDAARQCVSTIGELARRPDGFVSSAFTRAAAAPDYSFTLGVCSIDEARLERTTARYRRLFAGTRHEIVAVRNPASLALAYNDIVQGSDADIVVVSHDDIDVLADDFVARLSDALDSFDGVGVVGTTKLAGPAIGWSGHPNLRGWIVHHVPGEDEWSADALHPSAREGIIVALDGVFLAAHRKVFVDVPFEATTFDGFHLYDLDWSYRASDRGYRLGVAGDLLLVHASRGKYGSEWERYAERFWRKHGLTECAPKASSFFGARFGAAEQARQFFLLLAGLGRELALS